MQHRPSSRLLVIDAEERLLLFKFEHRSGTLAGEAFWATPGGGLDPGESFEQAACRELLEETGLLLAHPGPQIAQRTVCFTLPSGEIVEADERYFLIRVSELAVSNENWTLVERDVMIEHRWWRPSDITSAAEQIWPDNIATLLADTGVWPAVS